MSLRAYLSNVILTALILLTPCLAGQFGQTQQLFAQYGIGGPAETAFTIHQQGAVAIVVKIELISPDGMLFQTQDVMLGPGATETIVFSDPQGAVKNGWARLTSNDPFNATVFLVLLQGSVVEGGGLPTKGRLRSSVQLHQRASVRYVACLIHV